MTTATVDTGVAQIRDQILAAVNAGRSLRIAGSGHWLDAGRPATCIDTLPTRDLTGIISYVPGDLTLTARAGTTLAELRDATAKHNQWLALDPFGDDNGTIGATVVTASSGPLATSFGTPRDLVLGLEFVSGIGAVVRGGGRVVKNVAGFDLTRLMIGSWGTLGVVTEVTVRLHAKPEHDVSLAVAIGDHDVGRVRALLRRLPFTPAACEVINPALAKVLLGASHTTALFRLGGNADAVRAQRAALAELGGATEIDVATWTKMRTVEPANSSVARLSDLPSNIGGTWDIATAARGAMVHASPARGVVRVICPEPDNIATAFAAPQTLPIVAERLPGDLWSRVAPQHGSLPPRVKAAFDPSNVLNPGILGVAP